MNDMDLNARPKAAQILRTLAHLAISSQFLFCKGTHLVHAQMKPDVVTYHNDLARTGQNLNETVLAPANVNANSFGKLFTYSVDGYFYTQPLYVAGVSIPGKGVHNVVYIATQHDSVYGFDADSNQGDNTAPLWQVSFINPAAGITTMPQSDLGLNDFTQAEIGITGTPVIDPLTGTLFVVAKTKETIGGSTRYYQRLHALDIRTGKEKFDGPVEIRASLPGTGPGTDGFGHIAFDPFYEFQRSGLLLQNGEVYVGFASAGDIGPYHGWIIGYDAHTLQLTRAFNDTPNGYEGGIWMSGAAPAADAEGNIYCMTGNGMFNAHIGGLDFGDSFLKLTPAGGGLIVADYFTPYDQAVLDATDGDLGSGAPLLLPDSAGSDAHPNLLIGCGKEGIIYLLDPDQMGHYRATDNSQIVQSVNLAAGTSSMPAYFNNWIYYLAINDVLKAFSISNGRMSSVPVSQSHDQFGFPGATPSISANGSNDAVVWVIQADAFATRGPAVLRAYNATNLDERLFSSSDAGTRDRLGPAQKFAVPTIVNGKVYVGAGFELSVFGNLGAPIVTTQPLGQKAYRGADVTFNVAASGTPPYSYRWQFGGNDLVDATNAWLTLTNVSLEASGVYRAVVSNSDGTAFSAEAELVVAPPPLPPRLVINPQLEVSVQGETGQTYSIEYTSDLDRDYSYWVILTTLTLTNSTQAFLDPDGTNQLKRFYRAVVEPF